jgi:16S rRNA (adenine1518-N6/adenine1519-N6)-dimethyltransferase
VDLSDPGTLRRFLDRHGLSAKKGLGQHFLCSGKVVSEIVSRMQGVSGILEIGPGPGVLTGPLSHVAERLVALEVDPRMGPVLAESAPDAEVVVGDALKIDLSEILERLPRPRAVVSNLPYYITGPLLTRIAEARRAFDKAVLMMQKEVAVRILAGPGNRDRGSLSVFLQAQFQIEKVCDVPAGAFLPPPKVDSSVLQFLPLAASGETKFLSWMRKGFEQPRKTLANNIRAMGFTSDQVESALNMAGVQAKARPADLTLEEWTKLFEAISE